MKNFWLTVLSLFSFLSFGQKSIYFSSPLPSVESKVVSVDQQYFGTYSSETDLRTFVFNENGVTIISTTLSSISKELVRENSKYDVRNDFLFGVVENDSVPCVLEDGNYYFGVRNEEILVGVGSENILTRLSNDEYVINIVENENFIPMRMSFRRGNCFLEYFDYEEDSDIFDYILSKKTINTEYLEMIILNPNISEAKKLLKRDIFSEGQTLKKG